MLKIIRLLLSLSMVLLLWNCASESSAETPTETAKASSQKSKNEVPAYRTQEATPQDQSRVLSITGRTQPLEEVQVIAEVQGQALATDKLLNEGIRYRKGETLVRIDDAQYRLNLQAQKSQFQSALVRLLSQIKLDYPEAHPDWDAYVRDFNVEETLPELPPVDNDQLRFFLSANGVFASYYQIKSAEEQLPKYNIYAPFTGVITEGNLSPGAVVTPGQPLATYSRTDVYELKAAVSSADIDRLKGGQKIKLIHSNTGESWTGYVHRIGGAFDPSTQSVPVYIRVSGRGLREAMFLEATLEAEGYEQVVALPLDALNRKNQVHVIRDSTVVLQEVTPVHYETQQVWVQGLKGGEQIIVEDVLGPIAGSKAIPKS